MSNPVIAAAKLKHKRSALETLVASIAEVTERSQALIRAIDDATTEEELETVEKSVEDIQAELATKEEEKTALEKEIEALEAALEESNEKAPDQSGELEGGQRNMTNNVEVREGIKGYIRSKGQERAGFTSVEGGALIPVELLTPKKELTDKLDLTKFVNVVKVNSGSGKYPFISGSGGVMASTAELAANPELAKPTITEVTYDIATYRGYVPVSQEVIDDADYDVTGLIAENITDQELNTKNAQIAAKFKTATAKAVTGLDGIVTLLNTGFKDVYNVKLFISKSLYNALDLLKDGDGRYLLQPDPTVASGKSVKGREVVPLDDTVIAALAGDLKGFVGDAKEFLTLFDRQQASVKWVDNEVYGQLLADFVRFDTKAVDTEAGYYITYTAAV
jgi:HK97 family phage major capsid protein